MKRNTLYLFFKKPLIAGLATFVTLLVATQYIAYQKCLINENEQKKKIARSKLEINSPSTNSLSFFEEDVSSSPFSFTVFIRIKQYTNLEV